MLIEFLAPSPKAGIKEHQSREVAAALIAAGFAQPVPPEPPAPPAPPTWDVIRHGEYDQLVVVRKCGGSVVYFDGPPDRTKWPDCPEDIAKKFSELKRPGEQPAGLMFAGSNWREKLPL